MSDEDIPMAQCGACNSIIPLNSETCPVCNVRFAGMSEQELGECGACQAIIPADSTSCPDCGAIFVETEAPTPPSSKSASGTGRKAKSSEITSKEIPEDNAIAVIKDDREAYRDDIEDPHTEEVIQDVEGTQDELEAEEIEEESVQDAVESHDELEAQEIEEEAVQDVVESEDDEPASELNDSNEQEVVEDVSIDDSEVISDESEPEISEEEMHQENTSKEDVSEEVDSEDDISEDASVQNMMDDLVDELGEEDLVDETVEEEETVDETVEEETVDETVEEEETVDETVEEEETVDETVEEEETVDETVEDEHLEEKEPESPIEESEIVMAFENLALAIAAKGMTAAEAFGEMDSSDDNLIDAPELQKGIEKIAGEKLTPKHVTAILKYLDTDGDRRVDPNELVKALEDMKIGIQPGDIPKVKTFPSPLQKFLMGKKANDIFYPVAYFLMVTFIGLWVINGMGILVDGSGGTVVYDGGTDQWGGEITEANWNLCESDAFDEMIDPCRGTVSVGETYPCDPALDPNKCQNSLTPFSGKNGASSMPAGFYGDGIFMIVAGVIGLSVIAYLHLKYAPSLRERAKKGDSESADEETSDDEETPEDESKEQTNDEDDEDSVLEAPSDLEIADEDEDDDFDDDIDIGDWIGLEVDGEEFFGEIIEFDDDEGLVTIETEDGEEITGDQDDMFLDDE